VVLGMEQVCSLVMLWDCTELRHRAQAHLQCPAKSRSSRAMMAPQVAVPENPMLEFESVRMRFPEDTNSLG